jgi:hypothetical protein
VVAPEDSVPQVDPDAPEGAVQDPQAPAPAPATPEVASDASADDAPEHVADTAAAPPAAADPEAGTAPGADAPQDGADATAQGDAGPAPQGEGDTAPEGAAAPQDATANAEDAAPITAEHELASTGEGAAPVAAEGGSAEGQAPAEGGDAPAEGSAGEGQPQAQGEQGEGQPQAEGDAPKKRRRSRGRRANRGGAAGPGGRRRFAWDEVFLRQRLELLRAMDPDPEAIAWAVDTAGRFDVADILAGEGSSGREFGRRAYGATPETDDQAAWIVLAAVRARDIVPVVRRAVSATDDQREQVKNAIETVGIARVNPALQGERPSQQVFAERARRVDVTVQNGEDQKAAWALLALARPQDVKFAASPPRPRPGGPGGGPGGPGGPGRGGPGGPGGGRGGFGGDRGGRPPRREPPIPGGMFSVGESGIGGELGAKLRAALAEAEEKAKGASDDDAPTGDS